MFSNIIVAVDGSPSNLPAVDLAARLSAEAGVKLTLMHVAVPNPVRGSGGMSNAEEAKAVLSDMRARLERQGGVVASEYLAVAGLRGPAFEIVEAAKEIGCDLIITGSRGHSAWAGLVLGSVSQRILHFAPCPVLVVPSE